MSALEASPGDYMSTNLGSWSSPNCPESVETSPQSKEQRGNTVTTVREWQHLSPSERLFQNGTVSAEILKETPILSVLMTILYEFPGKSVGHNLSRRPCYHHLLHILSYFYAATSHLHCVWTKSHTVLPTCAFCPHHSPGMYPGSLSFPELYLSSSSKASTILLATLISKTEGLILPASQRDSSWSFSPAPFVSVKDLLCTFTI